MIRSDDPLAAVDAELVLLAAQNQWLKDYLARLQLPDHLQADADRWLLECGMPTDLCERCGVAITKQPAAGFIARCGNRVVKPRIGGCGSNAGKN